MRTLITTCAIVAAFALFAGTAQAGHGYGGYSFCAPSYQSVQPRFAQPHYHWHDTTHWDYHPTTITPHGNHYHVNPGHWHLHQTGHYDLHW